MSQEQEKHRKPRNHRDPIPKSSFIPDPLLPSKKKFSRFRGLGCSAPATAQVSVPAMIRTSASWEGKKARKNKIKNNFAEDSIPVPAACLVGPEVWCGPGIGLSTDAASVDCVVARRSSGGGGRGKVDVEKINNNRGSFGGRRMVHPEDLSFFDTDSGIPHHRLDVFGSRHHHHLRHPSPEGLAEIVMLQGNLLMGGRLDHDRYRDWRLDVDHMSYEQLLELGEKIGYVSTGLREDEIRRCVKKAKPPLNTENQWKCTICQEEHEGEEEIGKLECGHLYHMYCIKEWLRQKKTCPICKAAVHSQQ
ncbi:uncharacterized protein LOC143601418 [Bidens hawaiensis]|uniref:uncharacterized protein LOC143601418 n=1 Tax=Bidens hawaiensis TaxID=980011 RepID=UPI00404982D2